MFRFSLRWIVIGLVAAGAAIAPLTAGAADNPPTSAVAKEKKRNTMPFTGKIKAVDKTAQSLTLAGKAKDRVFYLNSQTKITKDGKTALVDDLVAGEEVGGLSKLGDDGKATIVSLRIGRKPEGTTDSKNSPHPPAGAP